MLHQVNGRRSKAYKSVAEDSKLWVCRPNRALHVRTDRVLASTLFGSDILEEGVLRMMNGSPCSTAFGSLDPFRGGEGRFELRLRGSFLRAPTPTTAAPPRFRRHSALACRGLIWWSRAAPPRGHSFRRPHAKSGSCLHNSKHSARLEGLQAHKVGLDTALHHAAALAQASKQPEPPASLAVSHLRRRTRHQCSGQKQVIKQEPLALVGESESTSIILWLCSKKLLSAAG